MNLKHLATFSIVACISLQPTMAQYGPGGVGDSTENVLWLRADRGTSTTIDGAALGQWNDQSRNSNHVAQATLNQRPLFRTNVLNGYPAIEFDNNTGTNDFLVGADSPELDNTAGLSIFSVIRPTSLNGNARSIVAKRVNVGVNQSYMFFFFSSNYLYVDVVSNNNRFSTSPTAFSSNTNYILDLWYDGTLAAASRCRVYSNQNLLVTANESNASIPDFASPLILGATHTTDDRPFGGYMAEVIIYRTALNTAQRIIVDNYLSAKYNIALAANNVYLNDNPANGDFDHDVAGIGRVNASNQHVDAKGSGILRINNADDLGNDEFLLWGHDGADADANETMDVPAGVEARFERIWRFSEVNIAGVAVDVGAVDIQWDLTGKGPVDASQLRLLIDSDGDGVFSDETAITGALDLGDSLYGFTSITGIQNGTRMTLGTSNELQTPLPVDLLAWSAKRIGENLVQINWSTATERNADRFDLYQSLDLENWALVHSETAMGNSNSHSFYKVIDSDAPSHAQYYKMLQVDQNGKTIDYGIRSVTEWRFGSGDTDAFPIPANEQLTIKSNECNCQLSISSAAGMDVSHLVLLEEKGNTSSCVFNIARLETGTYVWKCGDSSGKFLKIQR